MSSNYAAVQKAQVFKPAGKAACKRHMGRPFGITMRCEKRRTFRLLEAGSGHHADAGGIEHLQAIQEVRLHVLLMSGLDRLCRQKNARESVQGSLDLCAHDVLHLVEGSCQLDGAAFERLVQAHNLLLMCTRMYEYTCIRVSS